MHVDSQAALSALKGYSVNSRLVNECKKAIDVLADKYRFRLYWDEIAVEFARFGSKGTNLDRVESVKLSISYYYRLLLDWLVERGNRSWEVMEVCKVPRAN